MEHVNEVCCETNLSHGVKHKGLSRFWSTQLWAQQEGFLSGI